MESNISLISSGWYTGTLIGWELSKPSSVNADTKSATTNWSNWRKENVTQLSYFQIFQWILIYLSGPSIEYAKWKEKNERKQSSKKQQMKKKRASEQLIYPWVRILKDDIW